MLITNIQIPRFGYFHYLLMSSIRLSRFEIVNYLLAKIDWLRGSVERCVRSGVHCIDLCAALHQQLCHLQAWKESVLAFFEEILAFQGVVPHHRQVQEGVAARRSWVDAMHDVMNSASKGDVVVAALKLRHQV